MLYVYGVVRSSHQFGGLKGVGKPAQPVLSVESSGIAAAVSEVPQAFALTEQVARTHLRVLTDLLEKGPVIPLRMGTVAPDESAVRAEILDGGHGQLTQLLDRLDGWVEVHVDADDDESETVREVARLGLTPMPSGSDFQSRLEYGAEIANLVVARRRQIAEEILETLRPLAVDECPRALLEGPEDPVLRWAFLIGRDDLPAFDQAVAQVRAEHPSLQMSYVGPLPAAHFLQRQGVEGEWQRGPDDAWQRGPDDAWQQAGRPHADDAFTSQSDWGW